MKISIGKLAKSFFVAVVMTTVLGLLACSSVADGDPVENDIPDEDRSSSSVTKRSSSSGEPVGESSSSAVKESSASRADSVLTDLVKFVDVPATTLKHGTVSYSVSGFSIAETEVTRGMYVKLMGKAPQMDKTGDDIAVANLNWYEAVLFCNEVSKSAGLDTAYIYEAVGEDSYLDRLTIDYAVNAVRLPTETEWEIAARAGTTTTYYWDVQLASKYAYYGQTKGPSAVKKFIPNGYGLYDMGGNVAEWINDWYGAYSVDNEVNYSGPETGDYRVVRGGGWSDKAPALGSANRERKDPLHKSQMLGFRLVHSVGF